jgi:putative lipoprotein
MKGAIAMACSAILTACSAGLVLAQDARPSVTGTLTYRERVALVPEAVIQVQLVNVSRLDAPAVVLSEQRFTAGGNQVPLPFQLPYDPALIQPGDMYAVQARISVADDLLFITTDHYAVLTRGQPSNVDLMLQRVAPLPTPACDFVLGFRALYDAAPGIVGPCVDNQTFSPDGDALQHTSNGTLRWRKSDNWTGFTDGTSTWVLGPNGLQQRSDDERFDWEAEYIRMWAGQPVRCGKLQIPARAF